MCEFRLFEISLRYEMFLNIADPIYPFMSTKSFRESYYVHIGKLLSL